MTADTPCLGCEYPAACGETCEYDRIDQEEITRIVAEHHTPHQAGHGEAEGALRPFREDEGGVLYLGDVLAILARLEPESVDAVVTDPPYGLGFMGAGTAVVGFRA